MPEIILNMHSPRKFYLPGYPLETVSTVIVNLQELSLYGEEMVSLPDKITREENCLGNLKKLFQTTIKKAIVEDHRLYRQGMLNPMKRLDRCHVIWEVGNGREGTEINLEGAVPDVVLLG